MTPNRNLLRDPTHFPPGGFVFEQPELRWKAPNPLSEDLNALANRVRTLRLNNPRLRLPTSLEVIKLEIQAFICARHPEACYGRQEATAAASKAVYSAGGEVGRKKTCRSCGK